jgi:hypothetical protein
MIPAPGGGTCGLRVKTEGRDWWSPPGGEVDGGGADPDGAGGFCAGVGPAAVEGACVDAGASGGGDFAEGTGGTEAGVAVGPDDRPLGAAGVAGLFCCGVNDCGRVAFRFRMEVPRLRIPPGLFGMMFCG